MNWRPRMVGWEGNRDLEKIISLDLEALKVTFHLRDQLLILARSLYHQHKGKVLTQDQ